MKCDLWQNFVSLSLSSLCCNNIIFPETRFLIHLAIFRYAIRCHLSWFLAMWTPKLPHSSDCIYNHKIENPQEIYLLWSILWITINTKHPTPDSGRHRSSRIARENASVRDNVRDRLEDSRQKPYSRGASRKEWWSHFRGSAKYSSYRVGLTSLTHFPQIWFSLEVVICSNMFL